MTEVLQVDRDAAASAYFAWIGPNHVIPAKIREGRADDHSMVQAFARHRTAGQVELRVALKALQLQALQSPDLLATEWGQEALALTNAALQPLSQSKGEG